MLVVDIDLVEPLGADTLVYGRAASSGDVRIAARLPFSMQGRAGKLPLRYQAAHAHYFDPASERFTFTMSATGIPSVMQTISEISASIASAIASAAPGGGT